MDELKKLSFPLSLPDQPTRGAYREIWKKHLEAWQQSGLQQIEYCRRQNISYDKFRSWKKRLSKSAGTSVKLVEVKNIPHDYKLQDNSTPFCSGSYPGNTPGRGPHGVGKKSGVGFRCGEFYIEVDENFSSGCLSQLLHVLHHSNWRNSSDNGNGFGGEDVDSNTGC
jgi:hypothetical protein